MRDRLWTTSKPAWNVNGGCVTVGAELLRATVARTPDATAVPTIATMVVHPSTTMDATTDAQTQTRTHQLLAGARILVAAAVTVGEHAVHCIKHVEILVHIEKIENQQVSKSAR